MIRQDILEDLGLNQFEARRVIEQFDIDDDILVCKQAETGGTAAYLVVTTHGLEIACEDCVVNHLERSRKAPETWVKAIFHFDEISTIYDSDDVEEYDSPLRDDYDELVDKAGENAREEAIEAIEHIRGGDLPLLQLPHPRRFRPLLGTLQSEEEQTDDSLQFVDHGEDEKPRVVQLVELEKFIQNTFGISEEKSEDIVSEVDEMIPYDQRGDEL